MKEATGELSMTVIVIIGAIAIITIFAILRPMMGNYINKIWKDKIETAA